MTPRHFAWQARHKLTSTVVLRGKHGTNSHIPSFCVAGVSQMALRGALGLGLVARDAAELCVAGAAQTQISTIVLRETHIYRRFAWQAWHRWHWVARLVLVSSPVTPRHFAWQVRHKLTSTVVLRGRRGTNSHLPPFCVAGVAQMALVGALGLGLVARDAAALCVASAAQTHIYRRFAWQAWHKLTSTIVLRGRCGTNLHLPSFCVAGVAQTHIYRRFAWQAWHKLTSTVVLCGRHGTNGTGWRAWSWSPVTPRHFAWQVRHKLTSTVVLRGMHGTNSHLPSFCVAIVAQMALGGVLVLGLVAREAAALCVADAAQTHIYRRFAWQAWHKLASTVVLRGRRGTDGTGWRAWSWFSRP